MGSPAQMFKLGSGLATTFSGGAKTPNTFVQQVNPYAFNPYSVNIMEPALMLQEHATGEEADLLEQQGHIAVEEAQRNATQTAFNARRFREQQANAYNGSGILLEGSPMMVLDETRRLAQEEVDAMMKQGGAYDDLYRRKAVITRNEGRAAILGQRAQFDVQKMQFESQSAGFAAQQAQAKIMAQPIQRSRLADTLNGLGGLLDLFGGGSGSKTSTGSTRTASGAGNPFSDPQPLATIHGAIPSVGRQAAYNFQPWQM